MENFESSMIAFIYGNLDRHVNGSGGFSNGLFEAASSLLGYGCRHSSNQCQPSCGWSVIECCPEELGERPQGFIASFSARPASSDGCGRLITPFLQSSQWAIETAGQLEISAIQVLGSIADGTVLSELRGELEIQSTVLDWRDDDSSHHVKIAVNCGEVDSFAVTASKILQDSIGRLSRVLRHSGAVEISEPPAWRYDASPSYWPSPQRMDAAVSGITSEWSMQGIGWIVQNILVAAKGSGFDYPLFVTVERLDGYR